MKKIVTLLFLFLFFLPLCAKTEISLKEKDKRNSTNGHDRTEIIVPCASIEDGVIIVETELATWGVTVAIYNSDGALIHTSVSPAESKVHEFAVGLLSAEDYTIEVQIGSDIYEGIFFL